MPDSDDFWDFYWEVRLQELEDLGKKEAVLAISRLIRTMSEGPVPRQPLRLLELGCGEGQIIGSLVNAHAQAVSRQASCGVDYSRRAIEICRRAYPGMTFIESDFTDQERMAALGQFEIVMLVNALHEVFSRAVCSKPGEVDLPQAKRQVEQALAGAAERLSPGGFLGLFDGLEYPGDLEKRLLIRFTCWPARLRFETFARQYVPFRISFRDAGDPFTVELSLRSFTRYITKSIFLEKPLWQTERLESYQYFNESEFRAAFARLGLEIQELRTLTMNYEKWRGEVEILSPGLDFPAEHILILARKSG